MKRIFTSLIVKKLFAILLIAGFVQAAAAQNTLDKLGLTSSTPAAGVYSLRLLSSAYTGPLARITIGTNFYDVYPDAASGKTFSLNSPISAAYNSFNAAATGATASLLSSIIAGSTATVAIWYDQSGNGADAIQGNNFQQPEIINAGVIDVTNSLPTIKFYGTNWLVVSSTAFNNDLSGSVVFNATSANTSGGDPGAWYTMNGIFSSEQPGGTSDFGYGVYNNKFTAGNGPSDNSVGGYTVVNDGITRVNSWTRNDGTGGVALFSSGESDGSAALNTSIRTAVPSVAIGATTTGGGGGFTGAISEMAMFPSVYTDTQRGTIESNQGAYYGITLINALTDARLVSLTVDQGTLSPSFSPGVTGYTGALGSNVTSVTITAAAFNPAAVIKINNQPETSGVITVHGGTNTINVAVVSQDGTANLTYTLTLTVQPPNVLDKAGLGSSTPALAAYSLRKLSSTYTGNAIQVTRSSDNAAQDIGFSASGDLDVTALTAFVGSNTGYISVWYDQSGGGNNVTPLNGGTGPVIVNAGVLNTSNNSLPCAVFSGPGSSLKGLATYSPTTPFTLNSVAPALFGTIVALSGTDGVDQNSVLGAGEGGPSFAAWFGGYGEDGGFNAGTSTSAESIRTKTYASNTITGYFNSANIFSAPITYNLNGGDILLGVQTKSNAFEFLSGSSSEVTVFTSSLSKTNRSALETNQANYYGIARTLSSDATLASLSTNAGPLSPAFSAGVTGYTVIVASNITSLTVTAAPNNANAIVTINGVEETSGAIALSSGAGTATITVTAEDGTPGKTYTITVSVQTPNTLDKAGLGSGTPALAAYSLRRLSSTYTGNAIQVTRSNDNAAQDIGFTASGDLDVTALTTFVGSNNGYISVWYDQSGNGNDEKPFSTGGTGPVIVNAGTVNVSNNNLPCANFFTQNTILRSVASYAATTPFTMNSVAAAQGGTIVTLSGTDGGDQNSCLGAGRTGDPGAAWFGGWFEDNTFVVGTSTSAQTVRTKRYTPGTITGYINSQNVFSANITYNLTGGDILLGTQEDVAHFEILNGSSSEVTVFASSLSDADRLVLEKNQGVYYGVSFPTAITAINTNGSANTNAASVNYTVTFAGQVTGLTAANFTLTAPALTGASVGTPVTADGGLTWTVPVNTGTGDGALTLNLDNAAGIANSISTTLPFAGAVYTIDKTAPTISIGSPSVASIPATTGSVSYAVTYNDANFNASTLSPQDVILNITGTATGTVTVANSGTTSTVTIAGITGIGSIGISIASGTATDLNGNVAGAAGPSATFAVTTAPPALDKLGLTSSLPAAGAYSLRLLRNAYAGPLARITIGSSYYDVYPDATSSQAFSLSSPVSAAYTSYNASGTGATGNLLSSIITGNTATVAIWYDQSGKGDDAIQAFSFAQPEIINAGSIDVTNSLPTLKFSGSNWLVVTTTAFNTDLSGSVVFDATNANTSSGGPGAWFAMNGIFSSEQPGGVFDFGYGIFNNKFTAGNGPTDNSIGSNTPVNNSIFRVSSWTRDNSTGNVALYTTGVADGTATLNTGTRTNVPSVAIGATTTNGSGGFTGTISEMTVFPSVYTDAQRQTVEGNQIAYYGLPSLLADAGLASLSVDQGMISPAFSTGVTTYTESLGSSATSLTVTAIPDNPAAAVTINNQTETSGVIALHAGINVISVAVKSQDGTMTNTYTLTVSVQAPHFLDKAGLGSGTPALGAYSLRQLSTTYTGKAIQVTRNNDNTAQDIGFTPSGGLDVTALTAFVGSNTGYITVWYDQSGNANDAKIATNISGATGPVIVNAGTLNISNNNLPCAIFSSASSALIAPAAFSPTTPFSMNGVSAATTGAIVTLSGTTNTAQNSTLGISQQNGGFAGWFGGWAEDFANFSVGTYTSGQIVRTKTYAANTITGFINSQDVFSANVTYNLNDPHIIIGVQSKGFDQALMGSASEITVFTSSLGNTDRQALENNQSVYYGALSFPTTVTAINTNGSTLTNAASVNYTVTFANPVSGLSAGNFTITAPAVTGASVGIPVATDAGYNWTVPVNTGTGDGTLTLNLDNATGIANTINTPLPFAGGTYTIDKTPPTLTGLVYLSNNTNFIYAKTGDVVTLTFGANEAIQAPAVTIAGHTITATNTVGNNYSASYTMTNGDTEGRVPFILTTTDLAGNQGAYNDIGAGDDIEFDQTLPTATISAPSVARIGTGGAGTVSYTVTYADANFNTSNLTDAGITLNSSGTATGTVTVTGSGTNYTVTISSVTGLGTLGISAGAGFASDNAGNTDAGTGPSATFNVVSTDATLASLSLSSGTLNPTFSPGGISYTASVPYSVSGIAVTATPSDAGATVATTINGSPASGSAPLDVGSNTITVKVTAADGTTKDTYTVTVTRIQSVNSYLAAINPSVGHVSPAFTQTNTAYTLAVSNSSASITVKPVSTDAGATLKVNGSTVISGTVSNPIDLAEGTQTPVNIVVRAANGSTRTYTVIVTRAPSANASLSALQLNTSVLKQPFSPGNISYTTTVPNVTSTITLTPTAADPNARIMVNGSPAASGSPVTINNLAVGNNNVDIAVTAQDGSTKKTYTLTVTRVLSANDNLGTLGSSIAGLNPAFAQGTISYTLNVSASTSLMTIKPVTSQPNAIMTINGTPATSGVTFPITLAVGSNTIAVKVTAQDGITNKTYIIIVTRPASGADGYDPGISVTKPAETPALAEDGIVVHQGISPNGDGINDFLQIDNIIQYPDNKLTIMNRNGQLVYEAKGYDNSSKTFDGHSNHNGQMQLPGTYFYQLDYTLNGIIKHKTGFIVLKY